MTRQFIFQKGKAMKYSLQKLIAGVALSACLVCSALAPVYAADDDTTWQSDNADASEPEFYAGTFANTYSPVGTLNISGTGTVTGETAIPQFSYEIKKGDETLATVKADTSGAFSYSVTLGADDVGTSTYSIVPVSPLSNGAYTYTANGTKTETVTVTDTDGVLTTDNLTESFVWTKTERTTHTGTITSSVSGNFANVSDSFQYEVQISASDLAGTTMAAGTDTWTFDDTGAIDKTVTIDNGGSLALVIPDGAVVTVTDLGTYVTSGSADAAVKKASGYTTSMTLTRSDTTTTSDSTVTVDNSSSDFSVAVTHSKNSAVPTGVEMPRLYPVALVGICTVFIVFWLDRRKCVCDGND